MNLFAYFTDSVLRAPTIGCMLMCLIASIVGTFAFLQRKSLIGEALSHASYPGVVLALFLERLLFSHNDKEALLIIVVLGGASVSAVLGMYFITFLEKRFRVPVDASLSVTLSLFFGIGYTILSGLQENYPTLYRELLSYLFGQAATLREVHLKVFGILSLFVLGAVVLFFREFKTLIFDPVFAEVQGISKKKVQALLFVLIVLAVVVGIKTIGVVLMSAMLIFPAASSSKFVNSLSEQLVLAGLFGVLSGFFGVVFSHELSSNFLQTGGRSVSFPTGPMIVMIAGALFFASILFAPRKGLVSSFYKRTRFFMKCDQENLLKGIWKFLSQQERVAISYEEIKNFRLLPTLRLKFAIYRLLHKGLLKKNSPQNYQLTTWGMLWARKIVRLHRLWELYLVEQLKVQKERVHPSAEEMEHIITPEIEAELTYILKNPEKDPHAQPIPKLEKEVR